MQRIAAIDWVVFFLYVLGLGVASVHLYRTPIYAMDALQYMATLCSWRTRILSAFIVVSMRS